jgi:signal transduction histidine kinase
MALLSNNMESLDISFKKQQDIGDHIEKVKGTSRQLLQTLREAIWILNKEQVTAQEFFDKLIDYTRRYLPSYPGIQLRVKENFPQNRALNSNEALQLFRICQEAITNACKYAGSNTLLLEGATVQESFRINIQDNGSGFDMKLKKEEGHYGLKNMTSRARAIKAVLHIDTATGKGTSVTITL